MQGKKVILVTNLKPANMRGITSQAMVLAAEKIQGGHLQGVELVTPPIMSEIGQQLVFEGFEPTDDDVQRVSPKAWKKLQPNLFTDSQKRVIYRDTDREEHFLVLRDSGAPCTVESATDAPVR
jgi:tRNA-binding EMAP/Myf-like protein